MKCKISTMKDPNNQTRRYTIDICEEELVEHGLVGDDPITIWQGQFGYLHSRHAETVGAMLAKLAIIVTRIENDRESRMVNSDPLA